jgi:hypothetical protein
MARRGQGASLSSPPTAHLGTPSHPSSRRTVCTEKKREKKFLKYMEIQKGTVAKSYITNGLLIYD